MINKVTEPECWHSLASQSFGTHSYLLGTCQFGPGSRVIFAVPPFPWEVTKESQQSFLA